MWEQTSAIAVVIVALAGASVLVYKHIQPGARHPLRWPAILVASSLLVMTVALLAPPGSPVEQKFAICFTYLLVVFAVSLVLLIREPMSNGRARHNENTTVPIISANLENPVLIVEGHARLLQGGGVVFDTRLGQQDTEELIGRTAPRAQRFE